MSVNFPLTMNFAHIDDELVSPFKHDDNEINYIIATKDSDYEITEKLLKEEPDYDENNQSINLLDLEVTFYLDGRLNI